MALSRKYSPAATNAGIGVSLGKMIFTKIRIANQMGARAKFSALVHGL